MEVSCNIPSRFLCFRVFYKTFFFILFFCSNVFCRIPFLTFSVFFHARNLQHQQEISMQRTLQNELFIPVRSSSFIKIWQRNSNNNKWGANEEPIWHNNRHSIHAQNSDLWIESWGKTSCRESSSGNARKEEETIEKMRLQFFCCFTRFHIQTKKQLLTSFCSFF